MATSRRSKVGYLLSNMGWMTISNFASKILVFLMVPFYTRVLTSEGYGYYDLGYTAVTLCVPLLTLNVGESIMRFSIVEKDEIPEYFSSSLVVSAILAVAATAAAAICPIIVIGDAALAECLTGSFVLAAAYVFYVLFSQFARGIDHVMDMAFGGLIDAALLMGFSFALVLWAGLGVFGCLLGAAGAFAVAALFMAVRCRFWKYLARPSLRAVKALAAYGLPLSVNSLGWWINSSFGRYAVAFFNGVSPAGMLAAAYKVPSIPKAIQQIFVQAWQISAIQEYDKDDTDGFFGKTYDIVCCLSAILISAILLFLPVIAWIMFSDEFFSAWVYVPLLLVGLLFDCLSSVVGSAFSGQGDTKPIATSAGVSVAVAVGVCLVLVPLIGPWGAVVSSMTSSFVIWLMRLHLSKKVIRMRTDRSVLARCLVFLGVQIAAALLIPLGAVWAVVQAAAFIGLAISCRKTLQYKRLLQKATATIAKKRSSEGE